MLHMVVEWFVWWLRLGLGHVSLILMVYGLVVARLGGCRKFVRFDWNVGPKCCVGRGPHLINMEKRKVEEGTHKIVGNLLEKSYISDRRMVKCKQVANDDHLFVDLKGRGKKFGGEVVD